MPADQTTGKSVGEGGEKDDICMNVSGSAGRCGLGSVVKSIVREKPRSTGKKETWEFNVSEMGEFPLMESNIILWRSPKYKIKGFPIIKALSFFLLLFPNTFFFITLWKM